ncbi:hypothetical protein [Lysinibacillus sphaericus]|uniref:hypothetical protein n=1 Tax=Lysinibacillus sphaericus TaxID=1421 RepID=UPI003D758679
MSTNTPNYNLEKPNEEEFYDVNVQNGNMDKIDSALKTLAVEVANGVTEEDLTAIDTKLDGINQGVNEINGKSDQIKQGIDNISAQIANKNTGKVLKSKTYTTNGTFTVPAGVTEVYITGGGAGGGGGCVSVPDVKSGTSGGTTSFGSHLSLPGGGGGAAALAYYATGGLAGGKGGSPGYFYSYWQTLNVLVQIGNGGNGGYYNGGAGSWAESTGSVFHTGAYCSGGGGVLKSTGGAAAGGGGGDFVINKEVQVTPLTTIPITIGKGGSGGSAGGISAGNGGDGILTVEWWE